MLCETCADYVGGKCLSEMSAARAKFGAAKREQWEIEECDDHREGEDRPSEDEDLERAVMDFLEAIGSARENLPHWAKLGFKTPESALQSWADGAAKCLKGLPKLISSDALVEWIDDVVDIHGRVVQALVEYPELERAKGQRYRISWRTGKWSSGGRAVWGQCKPIPQPTREKYGIVETYDLILSLPVWMLLDEHGRARLIHHELMHPASDERGHPVAEFPETVARFGVATREQAAMAIAAIRHPQALERIERWGLLPTQNGGRQLVMFEAPGLEQVEIRIPVGREG